MFDEKFGLHELNQLNCFNVLGNIFNEISNISEENFQEMS